MSPVDRTENGGTDLSIALVNWNNCHYLRQCLRSIAAAQLSLAYDVVVADNGSTDGSVEMLGREFPDVRVILLGRNVGVARGNNECIRNSKGRYIYLLNNDTLVNRASIESMVAFLDNHADAAAVGGNLLNPDGSLQSSFFRFPTLLEEMAIVTHLGRWLNPVFPSSRRCWSAAHAVDWLSSASIVVRRAALEAIGLIDEAYFVYSDETDWQFRLSQAGWRVYYLPGVTTLHFGGGSFPSGSKRYTLVYRGRMLFARKHYSRAYSVVQRAIFAVAALSRLAVWCLAWLRPSWRAAARSQLEANWETLKLCMVLV